MKKNKFLGVDYGERRVGVAISDDTGKLAFPYSVFLNNSSLIPSLIGVINDEDVGAIVLGASYKLSGEDNKVMESIRDFKNRIKKSFDGEIYFEPELFTTAAAKRFVGKTDYTDASAAAIILQTFLDRRK